MKNLKLELLAPAGNMQSLKAAVANGANAVYLGLNNFSARANADNFSLDTLQSTVNYAHLFGVRVYLAMNTLIKDNEMDSALFQAGKAAELGVDALIVQDIGLITQITKLMPHIVLHASTQMGVHNLEGALVAEKLGFTRVILSRETLLEDIKKIKENTKLEIEFFVQGALCVSFSGNCYLSSCVSGYSGNRGRCMQLCRKKYDSDSGKSGYLLSPKDLCLLDNLQQLTEAGVTSFKIEGRMRKAEYVAKCCSVYSKALENFHFDNEDLKALKLAYNRGDYCSAHLIEPSANIIYPKIQGHLGLEIGKVDKIKDNTAYFNSHYPVKKGDGVKFIRDGYEVGTALLTNESFTTFKGNVVVGDKINITSSRDFTESSLSKIARLPINICVILTENRQAKVLASCGKHSITLMGNIVQSAKTAPLGLDKVKENISKLGDTNFVAKEVDVKIFGSVFMAVSEINELRRSMVEKLENLILQEYTSLKSIKNSTMLDINTLNFLHLHDITIFSAVDSLKSVSETLLNKSDYIVWDAAFFNENDIRTFKDICKEKAVLSLPNVARGGDIAVLKNIIEKSNIDNFIVNNIYGLELVKDKKIILGFNMNILNSFVGGTKCMSIESDIIIDDSNKIYYALGYWNLMTFCHCPKKSEGSDCKNCKGYDFIYTDETRNKFYIKRQKIENCYGKMKNGKLTCLSKEISKIKKAGLYLDFTSPNDSEIEKSLDDFFCGNINCGTRGNLTRGLK